MIFRLGPGTVALVLLASAGPWLPALQDPASRPSEVDPAAKWEELEGKLKEFATASQPASQPATGSRGDPRRWLLEFLERTPRDDPRTASLRLKARFQLAGHCLYEFDLQEAEVQLRGMLDEANPETDIESRQIAQYGLAQVAELHGEREEALRRYGELVEQRGWYAEFARNARDRLEARATLRRGEPVVGLPTRADLEGRLHNLSNPDGRPLVILFWSPSSPTSRQVLERYQRGLLSLQGASRAYVVAVALTATTQEAERARTEAGLKMPVLCAATGWLDPLALQLGVRQVPSAVLLGPRREYIARDLPPKELAEALRHILDW